MAWTRSMTWISFSLASSNLSPNSSVVGSAFPGILKSLLHNPFKSNLPIEATHVVFLFPH